MQTIELNLDMAEDLANQILKTIKAQAAFVLDGFELKQGDVGGELEITPSYRINIIDNQ